MPCGLPAPLKLPLAPRIQERQTRLACRQPARRAHSEVGRHRANQIYSIRMDVNLIMKTWFDGAVCRLVTPVVSRTFNRGYHRADWVIDQ